MLNDEHAQQMFLLIVVSLGMTINFLMLLAAVQRWLKTKSTVATIREPRAEIARLTLKRTIRIELCFFIGQGARLIHTVYMISVGGPEHTDFSYAVFERTLVTVLLVYISVADMMTRNRIAKRIAQLPGGTHNWYDL